MNTPDTNAAPEPAPWMKSLASDIFMMVEAYIPNPPSNLEDAILRQIERHAPKADVAGVREDSVMRLYQAAINLVYHCKRLNFGDGSVVNGVTELDAVLREFDQGFPRSVATSPAAHRSTQQ